jgi:hypothetical protein
MVISVERSRTEKRRRSSAASKQKETNELVRSNARFGSVLNCHIVTPKSRFVILQDAGPDNVVDGRARVLLLHR